MDSWTRSYLAALLALGSIQTFAQDALFCGGFELAPLSPTNVVLSVDESEREMLVIWDAPLGNLPDYYEVQGSTMLAGTSFWQDDRVWFSPLSKCKRSKFRCRLRQERADGLGCGRSISAAT